MSNEIKVAVSKNRDGSCLYLFSIQRLGWAYRIATAKYVDEDLIDLDLYQIVTGLEDNSVALHEMAIYQSIGIDQINLLSYCKDLDYHYPLITNYSVPMAECGFMGTLKAIKRTIEAAKLNKSRNVVEEAIHTAYDQAVHPKYITGIELSEHPHLSSALELVQWHVVSEKHKPSDECGSSFKKQFLIDYVHTLIKQD